MIMAFLVVEESQLVVSFNFIFVQQMGNQQEQKYSESVQSLRKIIDPLSEAQQLTQLSETLNKIPHNQPIARIATLTELGRILLESHQQQKAIGYLAEAKQLCQFYKQTSLQLKMISQLAKSHKELKHYEQSNRLYQESLRLRKEGGQTDSLNVAAIYNNIGYNHQMRGDYSSALSSFQLAEVMATRLRHPIVAIYKRNLAELCYLCCKDYQRAEQLFCQVLEMERVRKDSDVQTVAQCQFYLSGVYFQTGRWRDCMVLLLRNLNIESYKKEWKLRQAGKWVTAVANRDGLAVAAYQNALWIAEKHLQRDELNHVRQSLRERLSLTATLS